MDENWWNGFSDRGRPWGGRMVREQKSTGFNFGKLLLSGLVHVGITRW
jgi:hypothetical protein